MKRTTFRAIRRFLILILWLVVVLFLSEQVGTESGMFSKKIAKLAYNGLLRIGFKLDSFKKFHANLREFAHFLIHFFLAFFAYRAFSAPLVTLNGESQISFKKALFLTLLFSAFVAILDETAQKTISGRAFEIIDLNLNLYGVSVGTLTSLLITKIPKAEYKAKRKRPRR